MYIAYPSRENVPTHYMKQVGEPVTLLMGVGEGALAAHYIPRWSKDGNMLKNANISRGKDFSLHIEAVELSDTGEYTSTVIDADSEGHLVYYIVNENEQSITLTVFSKFSMHHDLFVAIYEQHCSFTCRKPCH